MQLSGDLGARIAASVTRGMAEQVAFTEQLMRFPSLRGAEREVQDFLRAALGERSCGTVTLMWVDRRTSALPPLTPRRPRPAMHG